MKITLKFILIITLALLLSACGGGGGGGGGNSGGGGSKSKSARPGTGYRVFHAALDTAPVDVANALDGSVQTIAEFGDTSDWIPSGVGSVNVNLNRATTLDLVKTGSMILADNEVQSFLLYGDKDSFGERLSVISDSLPEFSSGTAGVRVIHGAVGALQVTANVDSTVVSSGTTIGKASSYVEVPTNVDASVIVRRAADGAIIYSGTHNFSSNKFYTIFVFGTYGYVATAKVIADS
jgi:hypothetical protein